MISEYNEQTIDFYFMIIQVIKCYKELSLLMFADVDAEEGELEDGSPRPTKTAPRI